MNRPSPAKSPVNDSFCESPPKPLERGPEPGLVLLDFDGTLVTFGHDIGYIRKRLNEVLQPLDLGITLPPGYLLEGFQTIEAQHRARGATQRETTELMARLERTLVRMEAEGATRCLLVEGTAQALGMVKESEFSLAIVTRGHPSYVDPLLDHYGLAHLIDAIVTRADDIPFKPHPAGARLAAERAGLDPEALEDGAGRYYLVGDHTMDMEMARAAGAVGVGVLTGISTAQELQDAGAAHILKSIAELPGLIA